MIEELQQSLKTIVLGHLSRLEQYKPAHGRGSGKLTATELKQALASDPVYSVFGLDSPEYIAATLGGGTITSIHRKIGDAYEDCIRTIFSTQYHLTAEQVRYTAVIASGDRQSRRSLDVYLALDDIPATRRRNWTTNAHFLHPIESECRQSLSFPLGCGRRIRVLRVGENTNWLRFLCLPVRS